MTMGDLTSALCCLLTRAYLAGVPTTRTLWSHVSYALDNAKEELSPQDLAYRVLKACVQHPLTNAAPRDPKHIVSVLQWIIEAWQERGWPIPEALASGHLEDPLECPELCYKTYLGWGTGNRQRDGEDPGGVTLLESSGGIIHHTTGLTTWGGAAILANWVTDYPYLISGQRVLELGAGVGFTASVILTSPDEEHLPPASYVATDCHHHVLTLLHHNLELNLKEEPMKRSELEEFQSATGKILVSEEVQAGQLLPWNPPSPHLRLASRSRDSKDSCRTGRGTKVEVLQVDWRHPCRLPDVDVILAADVVYAHHLIPPLVALIKSVLEGTTREATQRAKAKKDPRSQNADHADGETLKEKPKIGKDTGSSKIAPEGSLDTAPEESSNTAPETSSITAPEGSSSTVPEESSIAAPEGSSNTNPEGSSNSTPDGSSNTTPDGFSNTAPEGSSNTAPEGSSNIAPEGSSNTAPEGSSNTAPEGSSNTDPKESSITTPEGFSNTSPEGSSVDIESLSRTPGGGGRIGNGEKEEEKEGEGGIEKTEEESKREGRRDRVAYIACTRRSHETMSLFLEEVATQGLVQSLAYQATLDTDTFLFLYNETHLPIKIYKLSLPQEGQQV